MPFKVINERGLSQWTNHRKMTMKQCFQNHVAFYYLFSTLCRRFYLGNHIYTWWLHSCTSPRAYLAHNRGKIHTFTVVCSYNPLWSLLHACHRMVWEKKELLMKRSGLPWGFISREHKLCTDRNAVCHRAQTVPGVRDRCIWTHVSSHNDSIQGFKNNYFHYNWILTASPSFFTYWNLPFLFCLFVFFF